jgi:hypothetical protein
MRCAAAAACPGRSPARALLHSAAAPPAATLAVTAAPPGNDRATARAAAPAASPRGCKPCDALPYSPEHPRRPSELTPKSRRHCAAAASSRSRRTSFESDLPLLRQPTDAAVSGPCRISLPPLRPNPRRHTAPAHRDRPAPACGADSGEGAPGAGGAPA